MNKYRAIKTTLDGITFASKREASRYHYLKMRMLAHEICDLELQPTYSIDINGFHVCKVKLDFRYVEKATGRTVTEDSKGMDNPLSRLKRKLVKAVYGVDVQIV